MGRFGSARGTCLRSNFYIIRAFLFVANNPISFVRPEATREVVLRRYSHSSITERTFGTLFVVGIPIGNLQDISLRAISILKGSSVILCEDTRKTKQLLQKIYHTLGPILPTSISLSDVDQLHKFPELVSYHSYNAETRIRETLNKLASGADVALVSDAGTPGISDPGSLIVEAAHTAGFSVRAVPGPSSLVAALSVSGIYIPTSGVKDSETSSIASKKLPLSSHSHTVLDEYRPLNASQGFTFLGFPPESGKHRLKFFLSVSSDPALLSRPLVLFESPHRILNTLLHLALFAELPLSCCAELEPLLFRLVSGGVDDQKESSVAFLLDKCNEVIESTGVQDSRVLSSIPALSRRTVLCRDLTKPHEQVLSYPSLHHCLLGMQQGNVPSSLSPASLAASTAAPSSQSNLPFQSIRELFTFYKEACSLSRPLGEFVLVLGPREYAPIPLSREIGALKESRARLETTDDESVSSTKNQGGSIPELAIHAFGGSSGAPAFSALEAAVDYCLRKIRKESESKLASGSGESSHLRASAKEAAKIFGVNRREVYNEVLRRSK